MTPPIDVMTRIPTLLHIKHSALGATGVVAAGSSGEALAGTIGGIVGTLVAVTTLVLSVAANNAKKRADYVAEIAAAEKRGHDSRNDEVARIEQQRDEQVRNLTAWMEFYRNAYANELQERAGAKVQTLPPQFLPGVAPPGLPPTPTTQLPPQMPAGGSS